jgi:hypothetical protein
MNRIATNGRSGLVVAGVSATLLALPTACYLAFLAFGLAQLASHPGLSLLVQVPAMVAGSLLVIMLIADLVSVARSYLRP